MRPTRPRRGGCVTCPVANPWGVPRAEIAAEPERLPLFCLEHVRAYNAAWDFYKGMSPGEIEMQLRADTAWQRPSWPLGRLGAVAWEDDVLRDPLNILAAGRFNRARRAEKDTPPELREPLATLGLSWQPRWTR